MKFPLEMRLCARSAILPVVLLGLCTALAAAGDPARDLLRYEREAVAAGQWWRLATAHVVHLGWSHLAMNMLALGLLAVLFDDVFSLRDWVLAALASMLAIDVGLYAFRPEVSWYVGLSGVLHGLLLAAALRLASQRSAVGFVLVAGVVFKLIWEQNAGPSALSASWAGGPVIVDAHLFGAAGGALAHAAGTAVRGRRSAPL